MLQDEDMKMTMTAMKTMTTTDDDGTSKIESGAIYPEGWKKKQKCGTIYCYVHAEVRNFHAGGGSMLDPSLVLCLWAVLISFYPPKMHF